MRRARHAAGRKWQPALSRHKARLMASAQEKSGSIAHQETRSVNGKPGRLPAAQGLYDPQWEHDACGVGFVAQIGGAKSHAIIETALGVLTRLRHRGACGCDPETGDGAGI